MSFSVSTSWIDKCIPYFIFYGLESVCVPRAISTQSLISCPKVYTVKRCYPRPPAASLLLDISDISLCWWGFRPNTYSSRDGFHTKSVSSYVESEPLTLKIEVIWGLWTLQLKNWNPKFTADSQSPWKIGETGENCLLRRTGMEGIQTEFVYLGSR